MLCLFACHGTSVRPGLQPIYYTDERSVQLLPTESMQGSIDMMQHLEGRFVKGADTTSFEGDTWVLANDTILSIHLFSPFGTTVAELAYAKDSIVFKSSFMDAEKLKPEYVLADFQVCFYPYEALQKNFKKNGFNFVETSNGKNFERTLYENGRMILMVKKTGNEIRFSNKLRNYMYLITLGEN